MSMARDDAPDELFGAWVIICGGCVLTLRRTVTRLTADVHTEQSQIAA